VKICLPAPDLSARRLRFYQALGVEAVTVPHRLQTEYVSRSPKPLVPAAARGVSRSPKPVIDADELRRVVDRVRDAGLAPASTSLGLWAGILLGDAAGDGDTVQGDTAQIVGNLEAIAAAGIPVATTNFMALRASEGYGSRLGGRGGAHVRDFDAGRIEDLPSYADVGRHSDEQMWERLTWFLETAVPAAAAVGVRLAMHPNDPPVPEYRGVAQPLLDFAAMQRLVETVDDPANSIYYDSGVATEWGEDAVEVARWFGARHRIATAHIRNVRVDELGRRYTETFLDDGDADIAAVMRVLAEVGYDGTIDPDHTPALTMDGDELWIGWAYAVGTLRGLR
jgi:mannonate dehydratase